MGWGGRFQVQADGSVEAVFGGGALVEGYPGQVHGGVVAAWLDGAMANCLFAHGRQGMTAELRVRFRHPVTPTVPAVVTARIVAVHGPLYLLEAELRQDDRLKAHGRGKFMVRDGPAHNTSASTDSQTGTPRRASAAGTE